MIYRVIMDGNDILNYQEKPFILINPSLSMELNTAGSFEFTMPPAHAFYDMVKPLASTIEVYEDETLLWFGRPVEVETDFFKQKQIYCEGALSFFSDPKASLKISQHESGGIVLAMSGLTVPATKYYYGGSYFYDGYYSLRKTERVTLTISSVGILQVPITEILYQGAESEAPDWAKTITDRDLDV